MKAGARRWGFAALLVATALIAAGCSDSTVVGSKQDVPSITARGVGMVSGVPDTVVIVLGVETEAPQASEALSRNNQSSAAVMQELTDAGVAEEDIQTSQFSIHPRYDDEGRTITGYMVTNLITARVGTDSDAGELIDAAAAAAGNDIRVQSVHFEIDDKGELFAQARADAIERAKEQAEQLADAAGIELGSVRSITESSIGSQPPIPFLSRTGDAAFAEQAVNLAPGTQELTLEVEVIYEISG